MVKYFSNMQCYFHLVCASKERLSEIQMLRITSCIVCKRAIRLKEIPELDESQVHCVISSPYLENKLKSEINALHISIYLGSFIFESSECSRNIIDFWSRRFNLNSLTEHWLDLKHCTYDVSASEVSLTFSARTCQFSLFSPKWDFQWEFCIKCDKTISKHYILVNILKW